MPAKVPVVLLGRVTVDLHLGLRELVDDCRHLRLPMATIGTVRGRR